MRTLSRRNFLKITGAVAGLAAAKVGGGALTETAVASSSKKENGIKTIPTYCEICFWKCGAIAYLKDGKLWKIEGNPKDPLSNGRLCPRGTGGVGSYYDTERVKNPLIRRGERGGEHWEEVTWDEALTYIADKMTTIKEKYGPESMALFTHGIGGNHLKTLFKAYGSPNISAPSFAQCRGPREVGFQLTFGDTIESPERTDIKNTKCLVLLGSHLGENMHNSQVQEFAEAIEKGATIIVADPRFSIAAGKAKYYLPIKPGTDTALLLAWMNVLVEEGLYDKEFVEKYGYGFEEFKAYIKDTTPEWAYIRTGIEARTIRETAREMARVAPAAMVHPGRHVNWYGNDAQRSRAIALVNALLGNWGRPGGFYGFANMNIPGYPIPKPPKAKKPPVDNPDKKYPFAYQSLTNGIREATITGNPYPVKGWMVYATNLLHAMPNEEETIQAINNLDLLVVIDVIGSEIASYADVVLPESTYLERHDDLNAGYFREAFVSIRQPVLESPHNQKPNWYIAKKLGEKLGLGDYFPWANMEDFLKYRIEKAGLDWEELKREGVIKGAKQPIFIEEGYQPEFLTPSGKVEFYSPQLAAAGFDPVPRYEPTPEPPNGYYRLLFGRSPVHSFSRTQSNTILGDVVNENEIWVNTVVAKNWGLRNGQRIKLKNQDGVVSDPIKVLVTQRIRQDCVYMVHGWGHNSSLMGKTNKKGASDAQLITRYVVDPLMGATGSNVNFVTFELGA